MVDIVESYIGQRDLSRDDIWVRQSQEGQDYTQAKRVVIKANFTKQLARGQGDSSQKSN